MGARKQWFTTILFNVYSVNPNVHYRKTVTGVFARQNTWLHPCSEGTDTSGGYAESGGLERKVRPDDRPVGDREWGGGTSPSSYCKSGLGWFTGVGGSGSWHVFRSRFGQTVKCRKPSNGSFKIAYLRRFL